ncbi:FeoB-associated Cys-rich membrane protein [Aneurinibacillus aneurinilyticus]|nr:FeoB-associated Cys-rich membrane protein [Aneurinibacillus aneurinilyticus]
MQESNFSLVTALYQIGGIVVVAAIVYLIYRLVKKKKRK